MDTRLLDILVCPNCKGPLRRDAQRNELVCEGERLAFPIQDGVPMMLMSAARELPPAHADNPGPVTLV